jgi:hypothetical protein
MLRRVGIVVIYNFAPLFPVEKALSMVPLAKGNQVSFLSPFGPMRAVLIDLGKSFSSNSWNPLTKRVNWGLSFS